MQRKTTCKASHAVVMGEVINEYKILVGNFEGKGPLGRPTLICEDIIRIDLRETDWESVD
jgi:hypothetical protein